MLKIKFLKLNKVLITSLFLFLTSISFVFSSTLNFSPEGGTYNVGDVIIVRVLVNSPNESINAVASRLRFTQDNLSLTSISKSGSIISLWAQEPTFSNAAGTASFEGIALSGYTGPGATVVTLTFRAKAEGMGLVNFVSGSVLANDGQGTNTLKGMNEASFTILPAKNIIETTPEPKGVKEIIKEAVTPKVEQTESGAQSKVLYYYINKFDMESFILISIWVLMLFIMLYIYLRFRYKVDKKLEETKKLAKKTFQILKEDAKEKNNNALESDIYDAEKVIIENIDEIEKM